MTVLGTAPLDYQWRFNETNLVAQTSSNLMFAAATTNDAGSYTVVITNVAGAITSAVAVLSPMLR